MTTDNGSTTDQTTVPIPASDTAHSLAPYDAILLLGFGGPEGPDEVLPFLRRVTAGRGIPDERLVEVGQHYSLFGGRSPINDQNRALMAALQQALDAAGHELPVLWGNRNSEPFLADTLRAAHAAGQRRILVVTTSAYSSYSSCRQYRENLADAVDDRLRSGDLSDGAGELQIDKIAPYAPRPGFAEANAERVIATMRALDGAPDSEVALLFVTHSIPDTMDETSGQGVGEGQLYQRQHLVLASAITEQVNQLLGRNLSGELVFCSRSGPPSQAWLEPDVNDRLEELAASGIRSVVAAPVGFISDHMEVVYDLDTEAAATAKRVGVDFHRAPTVGTSPIFVADLVAAIEERAAQANGEPTPVFEGQMPSVCAPGCCPNLRSARAALCGRD